MKRFKILIVVSLLAAVLAACGGTDNTEENQDGIYWGNYPIIVNGVGVEYDFYTADGYDFPTHVPFVVTNYLDLMDIISAGSQMLIIRNDEISVEVNMLNYLAFGDDVVAVSANDTFMDAEDDFAVYLPVLLFRQLGFNAYFSGGHIYIYDGESDMQ
ncbi:MAG: hypothetical protein FWE33_05160 [Defluviitaleaceae bacterium]|nr:hypothetical protein [Defluviitaleaceae bacterium]